MQYCFCQLKNPYYCRSLTLISLPFSHKMMTQQVVFITFSRSFFMSVPLTGKKQLASFVVFFFIICFLIVCFVCVLTFFLFDCNLIYDDDFVISLLLTKCFPQNIQLFVSKLSMTEEIKSLFILIESFDDVIT